MTHRTVAPASQTYEIRLYLLTQGRKLHLATVKDATPKRTRQLFKTVAWVRPLPDQEILTAELWNTEQEYAYAQHSTDADSVERLTGEEFLVLAERAIQTEKEQDQ